MEFVKGLNVEKIKNGLYAKVKTNMFLDVKKPFQSINTKMKSLKKSHDLSSSLLKNPNSSRLAKSLDISHISKRSESTYKSYLENKSKNIDRVYIIILIYFVF